MGRGCLPGDRVGADEEHPALLAAGADLQPGVFQQDFRFLPESVDSAVLHFSVPKAHRALDILDHHVHPPGKN